MTAWPRPEHYRKRTYGAEPAIQLLLAAARYVSLSRPASVCASTVTWDNTRTYNSTWIVQRTSKTWVVNRGWVLAASLAADLAAWCRLLGRYDCEDLKDAEPDTLRYRLLSLPARLVRHARARVLKISRTWPWKGHS
jgi:hypothetical protein